MKQYWDAEFDADEESFDEAVDKIEAAVSESVKAHSFADDGIKVGSFLSAGVDSRDMTKQSKHGN